MVRGQPYELYSVTMSNKSFGKNIGLGFLRLPHITCSKRSQYASCMLIWGNKTLPTSLMIVGSVLFFFDCSYIFEVRFDSNIYHLLGVTVDHVLTLEEKSNTPYQGIDRGRPIWSDRHLCTAR